MGEGNLLSLRWNNHISNFKFTLCQLQQKELYSDATLACDGQFYPVHKFVLSTCSDYFANMFEKTPCKHPVIVLKDVLCRDIEFLLSYMYGGEVSVGQADLPSLIKAAETLQIKGLSAPDDPPYSPQSQSLKLNQNIAEIDGESPTKRPRLESVSTDDIQHSNSTSKIKNESEDNFCTLPEDVVEEDEVLSKDDSTPNIPFPAAEAELQEQQAPTSNNYFEDGNSSFPELQVVKRETEEMSLADSSNSREGSYKSNPNQTPGGPTESETLAWPSSFVPACNTPSTLNNGINNTNITPRANPLYSPRQPSASGVKCETIDPKYSIREISQIKNGSVSARSISYSNNFCEAAQQQQPPNFKCPLCDYATHNRSWLFIHMRKHTGEKPFSCPFCSFRSAQRGNLNVHIKKIHSSLPPNATNSYT